MSWTPIQGTADYSNGDTISHAAYPEDSKTITRMADPFLNNSGTQDYTTYYQGGQGKSITPDPGNSGLTHPTAALED